jgi:hypothetical protein
VLAPHRRFRDDLTMDDKEFSVVCSAMEDCRRLIAAGKSQRWDVVKWAVTVNVALATAAAAIGPAPGPSFTLFVVAELVSIGAGYLVWHYNRRMTGARATAVHLAQVLDKNGVHYDTLLRTDSEHTYSSGMLYDKQELIAFAIILFIVPFLVLIRFLFGITMLIPN